MNEKKLLPNLPEELRAARIGTCYDPIARKLMSRKIAIDPEKLDQKALLLIKGNGKMNLRADNSTTKNVQSTFFAVEGNAKFGSWASVSFGTERSQSEVSTNETMNCYCSYTYEGERLVLLDHGEEQLFNYMTTEFQTKYLNLVQAETKKEYLARYFEFIKTFGYGCITELDLTSGSAFEINVDYFSEQSALHSKYSGGVGIGTPWGGGSVASNFAKEIQNTDSRAQFSLVGENLPSDTPTRQWCNDRMADILSLGLNKLAESPGAISAYQGEPPVAPEIPTNKPDTKELPIGVMPDITDELKKEIMKEDGFGGAKWEDYLKAQKEAFEKINAESVVREVTNNYNQFMGMNVDERKFTASTEELNVDQNGNSWNLGGFVPYNYVVKPWTELFPQLGGLKDIMTFSSIYIAKAYTFYLTRLQCANYLYFLADVGGEICQNDSIHIDAANYAKECQNLQKSIADRIKYNYAMKKEFNETDYQELVASFEQAVKRIHDFKSGTVCSNFFKNYRFFMESAVGFVRLDKREDVWYYQVPSEPGERQSYKAVPKPFGVTPMLNHALIYYLVLLPDGRMIVCTNIGGKWNAITRIVLGAKEIDENGYQYYCVPGASRYYNAGFSELRALGGTGMKGRPMINDFDFEAVYNFANPELSIF